MNFEFAGTHLYHQLTLKLRHFFKKSFSGDAFHAWLRDNSAAQAPTGRSHRWRERSGKSGVKIHKELQI